MNTYLYYEYTYHTINSTRRVVEYDVDDDGHQHTQQPCLDELLLLGCRRVVLFYLIHRHRRSTCCWDEVATHSTNTLVRFGCASGRRGCFCGAAATTWAGRVEYQERRRSSECPLGRYNVMRGSCSCGDESWLMRCGESLQLILRLIQ